MVKVGRTTKAMAHYLATDCTVQEAASKFKISKQALYMLLHAQSVPIRSKKLLKDSIRDGEVDPTTQTIEEMSRQLDCTANGLANVLKEAGISYLTTQRDVNRRLLQEAAKGDKPIPALSQMFGLSYATVHRILKQANIKVPRGISGPGNGLAAAASALIDSEGISCTTAASRVGCAPSSVLYYRQSRGLPITLAKIRPGCGRRRRG